jgi:hypothetical protein
MSIWYYHLVPGSLINGIALVLPWVELICGITLILGFWYRGSALLINLMLWVFVAALVSTILRGIDIDCGCFKAGQSATKSAWSAVVLDIALIACGFQLLISRSKRFMLTRE